MNKKTFSMLLVLLINMHVYAQEEKPMNLPGYAEKKINFGFAFSLTAGTYQLRVKPIDSLKTSVVTRLGFDLAIVAEYNLSRRFGFRFMPALDFQQRDLQYTVTRANTTQETYTQRLESAYLRLPLMFKISHDRTRNKRLYYIAGGFCNIDLERLKNKNTVTENPLFVQTSGTDYGVGVGIGFDHFFRTFKMAVEVKMNYGLKNMVEPNLTSPVEQLKTNLGAISITFEG